MANTWCVHKHPCSCLFLKAENEAGVLEPVKVSHGIGAVVLLNLQSYGGGRDLWGLTNDEADHHTKKTFCEPIFNDGLFEVRHNEEPWQTGYLIGISAWVI